MPESMTPTDSALTLNRYIVETISEDEAVTDKAEAIRFAMGNVRDSSAVQFGSDEWSTVRYIDATDRLARLAIAAMHNVSPTAESGYVNPERSAEAVSLIRDSVFRSQQLGELARQQITHDPSRVLTTFRLARYARHISDELVNGLDAAVEVEEILARQSDES